MKNEAEALERGVKIKDVELWNKSLVTQRIFSFFVFFVFILFIVGYLILFFELTWMTEHCQVLKEAVLESGKRVSFHACEYFR